MLASEAITNLSATELKQLAVRTDNAAMLIYLNEAIKELHKEFNLWQDEAIITYTLGTTSYALDGVDANVTINLSDKELLFVTDVYDFDGTEMGINDEENAFSVVTPQYNIIEFASDYETEEQDIAEGSEFSVLFRAAPIAMTAVGDPIVLPPALEQAMYRYAAFRAYASQNNKGDNEADKHFSRYERELGKIRTNGLITPETTVQNKFNGLTYPWP